MTSLYAYLSYRDAHAAIAWLEAIGFELTTHQAGDDGAVLHAELRLGDAVVMLATADAARAGMGQRGRPATGQLDTPKRRARSSPPLCAVRTS